MSPSTSSPALASFAYLLRSLLQLITDMWDHGLRFDFGPRASATDEEAAAPLLSAQEPSKLYSENTPTPTSLTTVASPPDLSTAPTNSHHPTTSHHLEASLAPVQAHLRKLKLLTPDSLPPYTPKMRTKSHAQILKGRLAPIGHHIVTELLAKEPALSRGALELDLCRHVATNYWPLPMTDFTHLHIMSVYRNAMLASATC